MSRLGPFRRLHLVALTRRVMPLALVAAYLPGLTFFGHWPLQVDIPGTNLYVGLPASEAGDGHDHESHCHADASSCSDTPVTTSTTVGLLATTAAFDERESPLIQLEPGGARHRAQAEVMPALQPPERAGGV